jgi:hypothetical protein
MRNLLGWYKAHTEKKGTSNVLSARTLERSITSKDTWYIFHWKNCFSYSISVTSTSLSWVAIVCKWFIFKYLAKLIHCLQYIILINYMIFVQYYADLRCSNAN